MNTSRSNRLPSKKICQTVWREADCVCFDVDSTVIEDEGLDQLGKFCGKAEEIKRMTEAAMGGGMDFRDALRQRLDLIKPSLETVQKFISIHHPPITTNVGRLIQVLQERDIDVYFVSGGFKSLIAPVAKLLNVPVENIFANKIKFFYDGTYGGFDESQPTSRSGGKPEVIRLLKERNHYSNVVMIGDGATDMEACPPADAFIGFGGNVVRESVKNNATWFVHDFATLLNEFDKED